MTHRELMTAQKGTQIVDRARLCLSLHLMTLLRKFMWRKLRKSRSYITSHSGVHSGAVRGGALATSSCKVGPESGAFFLLYAPGANPSCFGVILGCMGCAHLSGQVCRKTILNRGGGGGSQSPLLKNQSVLRASILLLPSE